jgi:hypothetical protein
MNANPFLVSAAGLLLVSAHALEAAAEPVRHAGRNVTYPKSVEFTEKNPEKKHFAGTFEKGGLTFHTEGPRAGEISTLVITGTFEVTDGIGPYQAQVVRTFEDGESITVEVEGERRRQNGGAIAVGSYRCVDGTGSLKGVACAGTYTSRPFANKMTVVDWEGTVTMPTS